MSFFKEVGNKAKIVGNQMGGRTKSFADKSKVESEIRELDRQIDQIYRELGEQYFNYTQGDEPAKQKLDEDVSKILSLKQQIDVKEGEISDIKNRIVCPNCGTYHPAGTEVCRKCGYNFITGMMPKVETPQEASEDPNAARCPHCGAVLEADSLFCANCGAKVEKVESPAKEENGRFCPNCGAPVENGVLFCSNCGAKLDVPISEASAEEKKSSRENGQSLTDNQPAAQNVRPSSQAIVKQTGEGGGIESADNINSDSSSTKDISVESSGEQEETDAAGKGAGTESTPLTADVSAPSRKEAPVKEKAPADMKPDAAPRFCTECGARLEDGMMFCTECGAPVDQ